MNRFQLEQKLLISLLALTPSTKLVGSPRILLKLTFKCVIQQLLEHLPCIMEEPSSGNMLAVKAI
jgi:hypothetical protein